MCLNESYSEVLTGKHLSDSFPIQNGIKQRDALTALIFNAALKYELKVGPGKPGGTEIKWDILVFGYS
jgi:hypothetical protein